MFITPIKEDSNQNIIKVFRDDVYPFLGGGNKGRKMDYIGRTIFANKANALVTTGGIQSNHCRAVAVFAAQHNMKCCLVLHGDESLFKQQGGNAKIIRDTKVQVVFVDNPSQISFTMDAAIEKFKQQGLKPYYIYGGGHDMDGGLAYIDAIQDLKRICDQESWLPDYIFLASGTGSTQAGILAGLDKLEWSTEVIGLSVGRKRDIAEINVSQFYDELCSHYNISNSKRKVIVRDESLSGGYGLYNDKIAELAQGSLQRFGFTLDRTYTAKAFYGMQKYIQRYGLTKQHILFWHTGGVFNYLAEQ